MHQLVVRSANIIFCIPRGEIWAILYFLFITSVTIYFMAKVNISRNHTWTRTSVFISKLKKLCYENAKSNICLFTHIFLFKVHGLLWCAYGDWRNECREWNETHSQVRRRNIFYFQPCSVGYIPYVICTIDELKHKWSNIFRSVEIIGVNSVCRAPPLPFPRQAASAAKLNDRVVVCGGNDGLYER